MSAAFSRLQLAAALIEYDNDSEDSSKPLRSAQESAIFLPFRNRPIRPPTPQRRSADYLGVSLPTETASIAPRESLAFDRKSRGSIDALRNPFSRDSTYSALDMEEEEDLEVDLASWGLDALVDKEKEKEKTKQRKRAQSETLPNPYDGVLVARRPRPPHARTQSMNMLNGLGDGGAFLDSNPASPYLGPRRHSIGDPLDAPAAHSDEPIIPPRSHSPSAHALIDNLPLPPPLHSIPFPSSETVRSPSPIPDERRRTLSMGSRAMLNEDPESDNPFAVKPPSPSRMSRFDPKVQERVRTLSHGTLATQMMLNDVDPEPEAVLPPRERRYSRLDLMRPKVLIMPSPLQSAPQGPANNPGKDLRTLEGFELTTDGRPLPFGAKAARRASTSLSVMDPGNLAPVASNSFTPNPRSSLTLSQLTFRNNLLVDGQRDVAYTDIEGHLKRATEEGEQIHEDPEPEPEPEPEIPIVQVEEPTGPKRPAGKLYGRSLIDDLEARKAHMRGKQRVFRGDDRPSMMARSQPQRSSTLITPDDLKRPQSQHMNSFNSGLARRNSANTKTLLALDDEIPGAPRQSLHPGRLASPGAGPRSVFGVDTLWERELAKLKVIEEQERQDAEERARREAEEEARNPKKGKKKGKGKERPGGPIEAVSPVPTPSPQPISPATGERPASTFASPPPVLPDIPKTIVRRAPPPPGDDDDESDDDSDASDAPARPRGQAQASGWHSDEDENPRRTITAGPSYPATGGPPRLPHMGLPDDDSSEEDVPLVATIGRAAQRQARSRLGDDDSSDEEAPLSVLLDKTKQKLPSTTSRSNSLSLSPRPVGGDDDEDEDETPLGLRVSQAFGPGSFNRSIASGGGGDEDEDDQPLGLHPDQLRKSQFMMAHAQAQAQAQVHAQHQMLAQAQMAQMAAAAAQQSMIFGNPSMMGSGFFVPPMAAAAPMMAYPQLPPTPPPMHDAAKFGRVDKWRHDVAVEGER